MMEESGMSKNISTGASISTSLKMALAAFLALLALFGVGLILTLPSFTVAAQSTGPNFSASTKTGPLYARPGDRITYIIVAVNTGDAIPNVTLTDTLPAGVVYVPGSCTYDTGLAIWPCDAPPTAPTYTLWRQNFATDHRITTTFAVTVMAGTLSPPLTNRADLTWIGGQHELTATTAVVSAIPDFTTSYKVGTPKADAGQTVTYTIVVINSGDPVTGVVLSDPLPAGLSFANCRYDIAGGSADLPCAPPDLWTHGFDSGRRITTTLQFTLTAGTLFWPVQNCAVVQWQALARPLCYTVRANPTGYIYLPNVMRNYKRDNYEPNDSIGQAYGPLRSGYTYIAYIWSALDQDDFYYFTPITTNTVRVTLTNIPAGNDYDLYSYYHAGGDSYPLVTQSRQPGNANEQATFTPLAGRRHFIRVYRFQGHSDVQPYYLVVTYQ
jgi:uncharacterized repeat protein (TIGR01451 family)